jgi:peptidyl-prolyl cis-trans isomerase SurA
MRLVLLALVLALIAPALGAAAQTRGRREVIERVVAVVNDEAIFLSELRRRAIPFLPQAMSGASEMERMSRLEQLYAQLLDALVDEELIEQAARDMQLRVTTEDVDRAIDNVRTQSRLAENEFWEAVRQQGFTESQYRSDVRRQLLRLKVLNNRARGRVNITEEDVEARYREIVRERGAGTCFLVSMILVPLAANASATVVAAQRTAAETLRARLTPENFHDEGGQDIGRICEGDLHATLTGALSGMRSGQISDPVRGPNGFYILYVRERAGASVPSYAELRQQIFQELMESSMRRQETIFLTELRRDAVVDKRL